MLGAAAVPDISLASNMETVMNQLSCDELSAFLKKFNCFRNGDSDRKAEAHPDSHALEQFFKSFADRMHDFHEFGGQLNVFEICSLGRDELRNCAVLACLLDENGSHGLGRGFLEAMLGQCEGAPIISAKALTQGYAVQTEFCPNADNANRVDIVCDGNAFILYIEVKIDSYEHGSQTERYFEKLRNANPGLEKALVFISPHTPPEFGKAHFIRWGECADVLERLAAEKLQNNATLVTGILQQYADFIRKF